MIPSSIQCAVMESLSWSSSFATSPALFPPPRKLRPASVSFTCRCSSVKPDPWSLSDGNPNRPKPRSKNPKNPLSDDNARRIIKSKAEYLSILRRNQGPRVQTPRWIKRTPEQMVQYLEDDQNGHLYGKHVVAAIKTVRALAQRKGHYDMRRVMAGFVCKLTFREMCVVLKEQRGWRQVRDFFSWMKLQLSYRASVIVYTIVLRNYGQAGKIKMAEDTFLEMLESGVEPDEVVCGTMLCIYARWGRHNAMLSFYTAAVEERGLVPSIAVFNFMLSSLQKKSLHQVVVNLWKNMLEKKVRPNCFTYTVVISSMLKQGNVDEARKLFYEMRNVGFIPEEVTYGLLITVSAKNGNLDEAESLYEDLRSKRLVPSNFTCASLLSLYCKKAEYSKALNLFLDMGKLRVQVDEVIYGLLITIYGKLGLYDDAERAFKEVEQLGLLSKEKTYLAMASVYRSSGNVEKASSIIQLMKSRNVGLKLPDLNNRTLLRE